MSIAVHVDLEAIARLQERIAKLGAMDTRSLMDDLGAEMVSQTKRRIESEKRGPDGTAWPAWSDGCAATRHGNQSLLIAGGGLLDDVQHQVASGGNSVEVGSNLVYAAAHQFGLDMSVVSTKRRVSIPARPFLGLSEENISDLSAIVDDFIDRQLEAM
ncbi:MAG: phage virion morphogenesis protein [Proteobacteria bacterium]|nr:phage virion morphogenesis protein [Pseudomonadota bacterium]